MIAAVADGLGGVRIIDVTTPDPFTERGRHVHPAGLAQDVALSGSTAYVAYGAEGVVVLDISDPAAPREIGGINTPDDASGVDQAGPIVFVADDSTGLIIHNATFPGGMLILSTTPTNGNASGAPSPAISP